jgi:predicted aldo/keto reductase-like oxidoreductase
MDRSEDPKLSRRHFLAAAGLAGGALAASQSKLFAQETTEKAPSTALATRPADLAKIPFGKTGLAVTLVGVGAIRLDDPPMGARLLKMAIDAGVNVIHTARGYTGGKSVQSIARLYEQEPTYRKKAFLFLKEDAAVSETRLDADLKNLNTDYVDAYLPQLQKPDQATMEAALAALDALKKKGKIRFGGFTCHGDMNGVMELILEKAPKGYDCCLISTAPVRPDDSGNKATAEQTERYIKNLKKLGEHVGIISMKSGASKVVNKGSEAYGAHMRVLAAAGVDTCITSFGSIKTIETALSAGLSKLAPTSADVASWRQQWLADGWPCLMCGQCTGACPAGLPVASLMRMVMYRDYYHMGRHAKQEFAELNLDAATAMRACDDCTGCSGVCPVGLASADKVRGIVSDLA